MKSSKVIVLQQSDSLEFDFNSKIIKLNGSTIQVSDNGSLVDLSFEDYYCQINIEPSSTGWRDLVIHCNSNFDTNLKFQMMMATDYGTASGQLRLDSSTSGTSSGDKFSLIIGTDDLRMELSHHETNQDFSLENDQGVLIKFDHNSDGLFHLWYGLS